MTIWSANASGSVLNYPGSSSNRGLFEIFPSYATVYTFNLNQVLGTTGTYLSLESNKINRETASSQIITASARYFNNIPSIPASPGPAAVGPVSSDGTIIWFPPAP